MGSRRLLMVSHTFPPYQESPGASIRFVKFIKYLSRHRPDWSIDVVTAGFCGAERQLPETGVYLLDDVPAAVRVFRIDDPYYAPLAAAGRGRQLWSEGKERLRAALLHRPAAFRLLRRAYQGLKRVRPARRQTPAPAAASSPIPDAHVSWHAPVLAWLDARPDAAYDLVFVTIPYVSTALLGLEIKRRRNVPLVLDVRDDWGDYWVRDTERVRIEQEMERAVVQAADLVVVTSPEIERSYRRRHPGLDEIVVIPNGVDLEDYADLWRAPPPGDFVVTCVGRMDQRSPIPFLQAFRRLLDDTDVQANQCLARFPETMNPDWWQAGFELGLGPHLRSVPVLEREAYRQLLIDSSLLLIIQIPGRTGATTGKMYEYWASGRPVLLLDTPGAGTALLERHGFGCAAPPNDVEAIHQTLRRLYFEHQSRCWPQQPDPAIQAYSRETITLRLIERLESLFAAAPCSGGVDR